MKTILYTICKEILVNEYRKWLIEHCTSNLSGVRLKK
ncbi:hypothetical protein L1282_002376 [Chryseobacterium sp. HSC-36S06]|nr:hypothetical protein [Chryseobacterium sp. HSC-36S06]